MNTSKLSRGIPWGVLGIIIITSFVLMFSVSNQESAIMDELAHIPSGYGYVNNLDYRLNPEHPPLIKTIAAFPLLFGHFNFPTDSAAWQKEINAQWDMGASFLYGSGNNPDQIIQWSRMGPMLITLLLIFLIYVWAKELMGPWWALLPSFLFALSPTVLEHGHFVTTDLGAAFGIFLAIYYFVKYLLNPSKKYLLFAGLAFGVAELCKFSAVLLIPLFPFLALVFYFWKTRSGLRGAPFFKLFLGFIKSLWTAIWKSAAVFIIGYILVYAVYFIFTINYPTEKQVSDTKYILTSFADGSDNGINVCFPAAGAPIGRPMRCLAEVDIVMAGNAITKPFAQYILGVLMVLQRSAGGNTAYFLGEVSSSGWWYYFPAVFLLKESIPSLILIFVALAIAIWNILKSIRRKNLCNSLFDYIGMNFAEFAMISFVILYWGYSMKSPLNIGVRHILPTFPFMYILASGAIKKWISGRTRNEGNFFKLSLKGVFVAVLAIWFLSESLLAYPYYLSYFNQFAGGTENGYKYATDSNYDWGQDLKRLGEWTKENNAGAIGIDYFGGGNLKYYVSSSVPWSSSMGNPKEKGIDWIAISVNTLEGAVGKLHAGVIRNPQDEYSWLPNPDKPYAKAGTSIFIYKL